MPIIGISIGYIGLAYYGSNPTHRIKSVGVKEEKKSYRERASTEDLKLSHSQLSPNPKGPLGNSERYAAAFPL